MFTVVTLGNNPVGYDASSSNVTLRPIGYISVVERKVFDFLCLTHYLYFIFSIL